MHTKTKKTKSFYAKESKQKRLKKKRFCRFAATYQATSLVVTNSYFENTAQHDASIVLKNDISLILL